ncbi:ABC-2 type transport system permease protein [Crossiella equi]|uniref:ABC-2 type transport system permease protein n=1 Tax=Crossiella equi TaxID=130796 RepID=A0ABS5AJ70_9PSEU|nr:ABC transporter permease subunit [Crossiella equi]MBP2476427.1 ABC-2 type transport system permease protein [Crossiella equi]
MTAATLAAPVVARTGPKQASPLRLYASELRWILRRPRTIVALVLMALVPVAIGIGISVIGESVPGRGPEMLMASVGNGLALPLMALMVSMTMLLPLVSTMSAADALAGEASHGTLRGLLIAPVSRVRLVAVKAAGVATVIVISIALITLLGIITGVLLVGGTEVVTLSGTTLPFLDALGKIGLAAGWAAFQMMALASIALAVSSLTEHPLVVLAATLGGLIVVQVLGAIPGMDWLQPYLLPTGWTALADVIRDPMPWDGLVDSSLKAACYLLIGLSLTFLRMSTKDG